MQDFQAHRESVRSVSFAPSDLKFATASTDSTLKVRAFSTRCGVQLRYVATASLNTCCARNETQEAGVKTDDACAWFCSLQMALAVRCREVVFKSKLVKLKRGRTGQERDLVQPVLQVIAKVSTARLACKRI